MSRHFLRPMKVLLLTVLFLAPAFSLAEPFASAFESLIEQSFEGQSIQTQAKDLIEMEYRLEAAMTLDPDLIAEAPKVGAAIAEIYLQNQRYQEAIWALDRGGLFAEAEHLAGLYEKFLRTAEIVKVEAVGIGVSGAKLVTFANGAQAIVKHREMNDANQNSLEAELWAYEFDRKVGFNLIPAAVKRVIGGTEYSVHGFITGARQSMINMKDKRDYRFPLFYLFDFLVANRDRHAGNSMYSLGKRMFGIDHGRIGRPDEKDAAFDLNMKPPQWIRDRLARLSLNAEFQRFCRKYAPILDMSFVLDKILMVKGALDIERADRVGRPFTRAERLKYTRPEIQELDPALSLELKEKFSEMTERSLRLLDKPKLVRDRGLTPENLPLWFEANTLVLKAIWHQDIKKLEKMWQQSRSHPGLAKIFDAEFAQATVFYEATVKDVFPAESRNRFILAHESILLELVPYKHDLPFEKALLSAEFESRLLEKIQSFEDQELKTKLFAKYIEQVFNERALPQGKAHQPIEKLAKLLAGPHLSDMLILVSPDLFSSHQIVEEALRLVESHPKLYSALYEPLLLSPLFYDGMLTAATIHLFEKLLAFKAPYSVHESLLIEISNSPNSAALMKIFILNALSGKNVRLAVSLIQYQKENGSSQMALGTFAKFLRELSTEPAVAEFLKITREEFISELNPAEKRIAVKAIDAALRSRQEPSVVQGIPKPIKTLQVPLCRKAHRIGA